MKELRWYSEHEDTEAWFVCRNGHLWSALVPPTWRVVDAQARNGMASSKRLFKAITMCAVCRVLKEAGRRGLRGVRSVHPDFGGTITARKLLDGTIEHHQPEQVAQAFSQERVKAWGAVLALITLGVRP